MIRVFFRLCLPSFTIAQKPKKKLFWFFVVDWKMCSLVPFEFWIDARDAIWFWMSQRWPETFVMQHFNLRMQLIFPVNKSESEYFDWINFRRLVKSCRSQVLHTVWLQDKYPLSNLHYHLNCLTCCAQFFPLTILLLHLHCIHHSVCCTFYFSLLFFTPLCSECVSINCICAAVTWGSDQLNWHYLQHISSMLCPLFSRTLFCYRPYTFHINFAFQHIHIYYIKVHFVKWPFNNNLSACGPRQITILISIVCLLFIFFLSFLHFILVLA